MFKMFKNKKEKMLEAAVNGNKDVVKSLLNKDVNIEATDKKGSTALVLAVCEGHKDIVELLLENGANIEATNDLGMGALFLTDNNDIIELLLEKGANIEATEKHNFTALLVAAIQGKKDKVKLLLKNGANVEATDELGATALLKAGSIEMAEVLLENGANIEAADSIGKTALMNSIYFNAKDMVEFLLEKGANIEARNKDGDTALIRATADANKDIVEFLLKNGASIEAINKDGRTALTIAVLKENKDMAEFLLKKGAIFNSTNRDINKILVFLSTSLENYKNSAEWLSEKSKDLNSDLSELLEFSLKLDKAERQRDLIEYLLEKSEIIKRRSIALIVEVSKGNINEIKLLLEKGVNIEAADNEGSTALIEAVKNSHKEIVEFLLENGANIEATSKNDENTALTAAAEEGHKEIVELLLEKGANIEATDNYRNTALTKAARSGKKDIVEFLLEKGANIEATDKFGNTVLTKAAYSGKKDIVEFLLEKGANIETANNNGNTALTEAAKTGYDNYIKFRSSSKDPQKVEANNRLRNKNKPVMELLLEKGAKVDSTSEYTKKITSILFGTSMKDIEKAIREGSKDAVKFFLDNGVNIEHHYKYARTALILAAESGYKDIVEFILEKGANIEGNIEGYTALIGAAERNKKDIVELLLEKGADINKLEQIIIGGDIYTGISGLNRRALRSAERGYKDLLELFLEKNADIEATDHEGNSALIIATIEGHKDTVELLLEKGANIEAMNDYGKTALIAAAKEDYKDIVELLLEKSAQIDITSEYVEDITRTLFGARIKSIIEATWKGDRDIVKFFLDNGANIEVTSNEGSTALTEAAKNGHKEIVELLLEKGASIEAANNECSTALIEAAKNGHRDIVEFLLEQGANIEATDNKGYTTLIIAVSNGHKDVVELLLEKGANEVTNDEGNTILHLATKNEHYDLVEFLLSYGIDIETKNNEYISAPMIAALEGYHRMIEIFHNKSTDLEFKKVLNTIKFSTHEEIIFNLTKYVGHKLGVNLQYTTDSESNFDWNNKKNEVQKILGLENIDLFDDHTDQYIVKAYNNSKESKLSRELEVDGKRPEFVDYIEYNHAMILFFKPLIGVNFSVWEGMKTLIEDTLEVPVTIEVFDKMHPLFGKAYSKDKLIMIKKSSSGTLADVLGLPGKFYAEKSNGILEYDEVDGEGFNTWKENINQISKHLNKAMLIKGYNENTKVIQLEETIAQRLPSQIELLINYQVPVLKHSHSLSNGKTHYYYSYINGEDNYKQWVKKKFMIKDLLKSEVILEKFDNNLQSDNTRPINHIDDDILILVKEVNKLKLIADMKEKVEDYLQENKLFFGMGMEGPIYIPIEDMPHFIITGKTGSGKGIFFHMLNQSLLYNLNKISKIFYCDFKNGVEFKRFEKFENDKLTVITKKKEMVPVVLELEIEMIARDQYISDKGADFEDNFLFFVIDEYADIHNINEDLSITSVEKSEVVRIIKGFGAKARASGIRMILQTQFPKSDSIDDTLLENFGGRVLLKTKKVSHQNRLIDADEINGASDEMPQNFKKGRFIYNGSDNAQAVLGQAIYTEDKDKTSIRKSLESYEKGRELSKVKDLEEEIKQYKIKVLKEKIDEIKKIEIKTHYENIYAKLTGESSQVEDTVTKSLDSNARRGAILSVLDDW